MRIDVEIRHRDSAQVAAGEQTHAALELAVSEPAEHGDAVAEVIEHEHVGNRVAGNVGHQNSLGAASYVV